MSQKIALVTGGSTGIGAAIAKELADDGFKVLITGRNEKTLVESAAQHDNMTTLTGLYPMWLNMMMS